MDTSKIVIHFSKDIIYVCLNEFKLEHCKLCKGIVAKTVIVNLLKIPKVVADFVESFTDLFKQGTRIVLITNKESLTQTLLEKYGVNKIFKVYHSIEEAFASESLD